jgi:hypothetical protein
MDAAYADKLDGKIPDDFRQRNMFDWRMEEQQITMANEGRKSANISDRALNARTILELANEAYSLYISQNPAENIKVLKMLFSNLCCECPKCNAYI